MTLWWFNLCLAESFGRNHNCVGLLRALVHLVIACWGLWREIWTYIYCLDHQGMMDLAAYNFKLSVEPGRILINHVSISCLSSVQVSIDCCTIPERISPPLCVPLLIFNTNQTSWFSGAIVFFLTTSPTFSLPSSSKWIHAYLNPKESFMGQ